MTRPAKQSMIGKARVDDVDGWSFVGEDTRHDRLYVASSSRRRRLCGSSGLSILMFRSPTIIMGSRSVMRRDWISHVLE